MEPTIELGVPLPDVLHVQDGEYRVKGHRICLHHILWAYRDGVAAHAMVFYYPTLSLDEIEKVLAFYEANRVAVDDFMTRYQTVLDRQRAEGKQLDREGLRKRFEAMKQQHETNGVAGRPTALSTVADPRQ